MKSFVESEGAFIIAGLFAFSAVVVSGVNIVFHLMNYVKPNLQKSIVRILLIIPIYSICSWASLVMKDEELYFDVIRDIYEAYIIYLFLVLILEYDGGPSACVSKLSDQTMEHPVPCCLLPRINLGQRFLRYCKQGNKVVRRQERYRRVWDNDNVVVCAARRRV